MNEAMGNPTLKGIQRVKRRFHAPRLEFGASVTGAKKQMDIPCRMGRDQSGARWLRGPLALLVLLLSIVSVATSSGAEPPNLSETRRLAEQGDANAQFNLAGTYYTGEGVPKDLSKGEEWLRKAAEQGHAQAQLNLGVMYYNGEGFLQDESKAVEWLRKAAAQGDARARDALGQMSQ